MITPIGKVFTKKSMDAGIRTMKKTSQTKCSKSRTMSYSRAMETTRKIDGITGRRHDLSESRMRKDRTSDLTSGERKHC